MDPKLRVALQPPQASDGGAELNEFFRFRFGNGLSGESANGIFAVNVDPIDPSAPDEVWYADGPSENGECDGINFARSPELLAVHLRTPVEKDADIRRMTTETYAQLIDLAGRMGYPHLVRVWNYIPEINLGPDDRERYKQFSVGRGAAFDRFGYRTDEWPAGTAVGSRAGSPLTITLLTTRSRCTNIENPRQTSAYLYPRQYGPRSPSFSRATIIGSGATRTLLISGTASIVGYESRHDDDIAEQVTEILCNINHVVAEVEPKLATAIEQTKMSGLFRVYLRDSSDLEITRERLTKGLGQSSQIVFLQGDICRAELDLEIEGVFPL